MTGRGGGCSLVQTDLHFPRNSENNSESALQATVLATCSSCPPAERSGLATVNSEYQRSTLKTHSRASAIRRPHLRFRSSAQSFVICDRLAMIGSPRQTKEVLRRSQLLPLPRFDALRASERATQRLCCKPESQAAMSCMPLRLAFLPPYLCCLQYTWRMTFLHRRLLV
jgi:hypothetical protein